jgi:hypothetical protein
MNPEQEKHIIEDLEKSGFSSELRAIRTFLSRGWRCTGFANYFDLDHEQVRGVDLRASNEKVEMLPDNIRVAVEYYIDAEVKKSERPWIVFKEKNSYIIDDHLNNLSYATGFAPFRLRKAMAQDSLYTQFGWKAYGIHESGKKPDAPSRAYSAFVTISKSAESTLGSVSAPYKELEQMSKDSGDLLNERVLLFVKPLVILDGLLLAANLSDKGEISIEEIKFAPVEFFHKSKNCHKGIYLIDIVTLNNLEEYIDLSGKRLLTIFETIKSIPVRRAT